ncbi:MAG TPA: hypothetical protein VFO37_05970 [Chitinophagaceae bacterium]|nr:hypothetical protein [Chitinophagaceae bacterium]
MGKINDAYLIYGVKPAQKVYWDGYSGYFKDLDGHLFEVANNPFWELEGNDNVKL